jgi:hypothetical protein
MADPTYEDILAKAKTAAAQGDKASAKRLLDAAVRLRQSGKAATALPTITEAQINEAGANINARQQPFLDALTMLQRGLSAGLSPKIQGVVSAATGGSFQKGEQQMREQEQRATEGTTVGGVPLGMLPEAVGGAITGSAWMKPLIAAVPAAQGWLGTLLAGGAEGNIYAQGQGQDPLLGTATGIGGAGLSRSIVTGLSRLTDMLPTFNVQENAAKELQKQAARTGVDPQDFIPTLQNEITRLGPSGALVDTAQLRPAVKGALSPQSSTQAMADAYMTSTSPTRNVSDLALDEFGKLFPAPRTINARGEAKQLTLDQAKDIYNTGLDNTPIRFKPDPFTNLVNRTFGPKPIGTRKTARDDILSFIDQKAPLAADGKTRPPMTARDLLEIKDAIDYKIKDKTTTAVDSKTRRDLIEISANINKSLKTNVPEIKDAAEIYSGQYAQDVGFELGLDLGKRGLKNQTLSDVREMFDKLTPAQKAAAAEGYRQGMYERVDKVGAEKQFAKVGPTKSNADLEIIDEIFGPATGQKFFDASRRIEEIEVSNKELMDKWKSVSENMAGPKSEASLWAIRQLADLSTLASQTINNKMLGGAFQGAFGREARALGSQAKALQGDQIMNWMTRTGTTPQTSDEALQEIQRYLLRGQAAPLPQNLAAQAGRVGAAFERSGR